MRVRETYQSCMKYIHEHKRTYVTRSLRVHIVFVTFAELCIQQASAEDNRP